MKKTATSLLALGALLGLAGCGKQDAASPAAVITTTAPASQASPVAPATASAENVVGKSVYGKVCALCHAAGVSGAPKPGDKVDWGPRIAQGDELLYKHALEGYTGAKGMMPARGTGASLSDDEVKAAVRYMVDASR